MLGCIIVTFHNYGRHGGLMVGVFDSRASGPGFEPSPETLCCVFGQDTLLSRWLFPPRCINEYLQIVGETYQIAGK